MIAWANELDVVGRLDFVEIPVRLPASAIECSVGLISMDGGGAYRPIVQRRPADRSIDATTCGEFRRRTVCCTVVPDAQLPRGPP